MKNTYYFLLLGVINIFLLGGCAKDDRIVLHSESEDILEIKQGSGTPNILEYYISKSKLAQAIASRVESVSRVFDISDRENSGWFSDKSEWYITFSVETTEGEVFNDFECEAYVYMRRTLDNITDPDPNSGSLSLDDCNNGQGVYLFDSFGSADIPANEVIVFRSGSGWGV